MKRNPVGWFEIYVENLDRAKAFYETLLDVTLTKMDSPLPDIELWAFPSDMEGSGAAGALVKKADCMPAGNGVLVYFSCDDCGVEASRAEPAGGKLQLPKHAIGPYGFISLVIDTEGNVVGLHSMQ